MAKRFTDTEKFIDPWFRRLSSKNKLLWDWITCNCDHAGFISIDFEFVEMVLGEKFPDDTIEKYFSERLLKLGQFKYFIPKFIPFQYGRLNPESRVHQSVIKKLSDHGIDYKTIDTLLIAYPKGIHTLKDKDKDMDKDKEKEKAKDKVKEKEEAKKNLPEKNPEENLKDSPSEVIKLLNEVCGTGFRGGEADKKVIRARLNEGFDLCDFERVIRHKFKSWGKDSKFSAYLRPQTLFGSRFDSYLQEAKRVNFSEITENNPTGNPYRAQRLAKEGESA